VSDADIVADYALTHEVVDQIHARREAAEHPTEDVEESAWRDLPADLLGAHAATMEGALEMLRTEWGGVDGYVDGIGVSSDVVDRLRAALITDEEGAP
jgi:hypothetical protein